jgi:hypothetical protein
MLMTNQQSSELAKPGVGSFDDPTLVAAQFAPIFVASLLIVLPVRRDQLHAAFFQSLPQRVRIVGGVGNHPFRLLSRTAFGSRNRDFLERGFRKRNFVRRGTFQPNSQPKTLTVDQYHPLRPLAPLGFADGRAPFLCGSKTAIQEGLVPLQQTFFIQRPQQGAPRIQPNSFLFPLFEPPPTGRGRRKLIGQEAPRCTGLQNPQNALETPPVRCPGSAPILPPSPGRGAAWALLVPTARPSTASAVTS